jgi:hypothetical protein
VTYLQFLEDTYATAASFRKSADLFRVAGVVFHVCLVAAWVLVGTRTAVGVVGGRLFLPADPPAMPADTCAHRPAGDIAHITFKLEYKTRRFVLDC